MPNSKELGSVNFPLFFTIVTLKLGLEKQTFESKVTRIRNC